MSASEVLIGIDAGTSVMKAVAFSATGEQLASSSRPNRYRTLDNGGVEQEMQRTLDDMIAVLSELSAENPDTVARAAGLAVTGQGDGTWLVDAAGEPTHDSWLWLDSRSAAEARSIVEMPGYPDVFARCGTGVNVCQMRTHMVWMQRHAPELLARSATAFHCKDWLYFGLTGERATDPSEGVFTFGSMASRDYDDTVIDALGLSQLRHLLPPIVDGIDTSAPLSAAMARRTGLPAGLPVTLGYVDVVCSALGGGLYSDSATPGLSIIGSTGMHMKLVRSVDDIVLNEALSGYTMCFPGGAYTQMQSNMAATLNIDWMMNLIIDATRFAGRETTQAELLPRLEKLVAQAPPGRLLYHPYISSAGERGPFTDPYARAGFIGLDTHTDLAAMVRAIYEGLALAARDCYDFMGEIPGEIRVSGGASRSPILRSILGAVLGRPVRVVESEEAGAAGACMIAATALGLFDTLDACCAQWIDTRLGEPQAPDADLRDVYAGLMPIYREARERLPDTWEALARQARSN